MSPQPALPTRRRRSTEGDAPRARPTSDVFGALADSGRITTVPIAKIDPNPSQPRQVFDPERLQELADSITEHGILQPPVVRAAPAGRWQLVAGERRVRAARLAGLTDIEVLLDSRTDEASAALLALLENTARHDLSPIELARAYASLIEDLGITREEVARRVGSSRASVSNHLRLLDLPDHARTLVDDGNLTFAHGRALLLTDDTAVRTELAKRAVAEGWSTRQLEDQARRSRQPSSPARPNAIPDQLTADAQALQDSLPAGWTVKPRRDGQVHIAITATDIEHARLIAAAIAKRSARNA